MKKLLLGLSAFAVLAITSAPSAYALKESCYDVARLYNNNGGATHCTITKLGGSLVGFNCSSTDGGSWILVPTLDGGCSAVTAE